MNFIYAFYLCASLNFKSPLFIACPAPALLILILNLFFIMHIYACVDFQHNNFALMMSLFTVIIAHIYLSLYWQ